MGNSGRREHPAGEVPRPELRHVANRRRLWTIATVAGLVGAWLAYMTVALVDDTAGRWVTSALSLVCLAVALRAPLLGLWVGEDTVTVRGWGRTRRQSLGDVVRLDVAEKRGLRYPAVMLADGSHLPVPGQEVGLLFEVNEFQPGWAQAAGEVDRWVRQSRAARRGW